MEFSDELKAMGVQSEELDEVVHELCQESSLGELNSTDEDGQEAVIAAAEETASNINNGGLDSQVAYLLDECGMSREDVLARLGRGGGK